MDSRLKDILDSVRAYLELEKESGMEEYFFKKCAHESPAASQVQGIPDLESLRKDVLRCKRCDLYRTRQNVVFGAGSPKAKLMFIGEAPGAEEDMQGLPFVGRAGQLLTKIIEAMGLKREEVYIANILKCRPPGNRAPLPTEILACEANVKRQVEIIGPKVICTLGKFASQTLLRTDVPISSLRGKFKEYNGTPVMPTFHPAYLLRNPEDKRLVWDDMKKIRKILRGE